MKQIFTFFLILFSLSLVQAQSLTLSPTKEFVALDGTNEVKADLHVTNSTGLEMNVTWERTEENMPSTPTQWQSQICDNAHCFGKGVSTYTFTIPANTTVDFSVHLKPPGELGSNPNPIVRIKMYPTGDVSKAVTGSYTFGNATGNTNLDVNAMSIFPNPASSFFKVENGQNVNNIEIFNIIGVKVLQTNDVANNYVDISNLKNGLYFVRLLDKKGRVLITQRLQKN